ncbi:hypothetical protein [Nonomuraea basaltis]|uniref:hypothetical protein n=1 Tax=Nonomuraea basaltis TaxID=2495887 RepID=UPI00110C6C15|nr:hypothetical protein [Nonomuraea basaltis]TMR88006.1 hypothetical protein EJK15_68640 [Nonomuraea basaltis]
MPTANDDFARELLCQTAAAMIANMLEPTILSLTDLAHAWRHSLIHDKHLGPPPAIPAADMVRWDAFQDATSNEPIPERLRKHELAKVEALLHLGQAIVAASAPNPCPPNALPDHIVQFAIRLQDTAAEYYDAR